MALSDLLGDLPSTGNLTDTKDALAMTKAPTVVIQYDTSPPEDQIISTDQTNILIRALLQKRGNKDNGSGQKGASTPKDTKGKRPVASVDHPASENSSKREKISNPGTPASGGSSGAKIPKAELESLTVEKLKSVLKDRGQPVRGRKEELLTRAKKLFGYK